MMFFYLLRGVKRDIDLSAIKLWRYKKERIALILNGRDVIGKDIVAANTDEVKAKVKDLMIEKNRPFLACLTFELELPHKEKDAEVMKESFTKNVTSMGGSSLWNVDSGTPLHQKDAETIDEKQIYIIPRDQIMRITDKAVLMAGTERESESFETEHFSLTYLKNFKVESTDGEELGKIKDVIIEEKEKKIIGMKLSEGFWEKLVSDGTKYLPYTADMKWEEDKLIVDASMKDQLYDEQEQLLH